MLHRLRSFRIARGVVVTLLVIALFCNPIFVAAESVDSFLEASRAGQAWGEEMRPTAESLFGSGPGGGYTLLPGSENPVHLDLSDLFQDLDREEGAGHGIDYKGLYGKDAQVRTATETVNEALASEDSHTGAAYRMLLTSMQRSHPDLRNDPFFTQTDQVFRDLFSGEFSACEITERVKKTSYDAHVPDYRMCSRVVKPSGDCTIYHDVEVESEAVNVYIASRGRSWLTVEFDLINGTAQRVDPSDGLNFQAIVPTLDYEQLCGGDGASISREVGHWDWPDSSVGGTQDSTVHYRVLNLPTCENGLKGKIQIEDTTKSSDTEFKLSGRFLFHIGKVKKDVWGPESCIEDGLAAQGEMCEATITYSGVDSNGCASFGGYRFCDGDGKLGPAPLAGVPSTAQQIQVGALQCNFNVGPMDCWTDPQGNVQCPYNSGDQTNDCVALEADPSCAFINSECVEGAQDSNGNCFVYKDRYDCGYDVGIDTVSRENEYQCAGEVRCMGTECVAPQKTENTDFAKATAMLHVAQFIATDLTCSDSATSEGGDSNVDTGECEVFVGEPLKCKKAVGGIVNCCKAPQTVTLGDYIQMLFAMNKLSAEYLEYDVMAEAGSYAANAVNGAWTTIKDTDLWKKMTEPFASWFDSTAATTPASMPTVANFKQMMMRKTAEFIQETFGQEAAEALFRSAGSSSLNLANPSAAIEPSPMLQTMGSVFGAVMTAYMIYQLTMLAINIIWECEESEFELAVKRQLKVTHYVGSYCADRTPFGCIQERESYCVFTSPLSRIIQEQARAQLGISWGSKKNPNCRGLTIEEISSLDWSKIDLTEWIGILKTSGRLPETPEMMDRLYSMENLTGSGSALNVDGNRENTAERNFSRMAGVDMEGKREDARQLAWSGQTGGEHLVPEQQTASLFRYISGPLHFQSCGDGCALIHLGGEENENNWQSKSCGFFYNRGRIQVASPGAIKSATLEYVGWDDRSEISVNGDRVWADPWGGLPPAGTSQCELNNSWRQSVNVDLTPQFQTLDEVEIRHDVAVQGGGEGYLRIRVLFDPAAL